MFHCKKDLDLVRDRIGQAGRNDDQNREDMAALRKLEDKYLQLTTTIRNLIEDINGISKFLKLVENKDVDDKLDEGNNEKDNKDRKDGNEDTIVPWC